MGLLGPNVFCSILDTRVIYSLTIKIFNNTNKKWSIGLNYRAANVLGVVEAFEKQYLALHT